jgi:putative transposase
VPASLHRIVLLAHHHGRIGLSQAPDRTYGVTPKRPDPAKGAQHLCLDKGYDNPTGERACQAGGYISHIRRIGEEKLDSAGQKTHPARRWVVERTLAWLQRCRAILIRYDKKSANYLGLVQLACALLWYRRLHRLNQTDGVSG